MNIKERIVARKIVFCYFFEQYTIALLGAKKNLLEDVDHIAQHVYDPKTPEIDLEKICTEDYYAHMDEEVAYIIKRFFAYQGADEPKEIVPDREYIKRLAPTFWKYLPIVRDLVNTYKVTFSFDDMDVLDRVIFVLGYAEYMELATPREVVINEMVEFGKRYGDESSSKLINGIAHHMLTPSSGTTSTSAIDRVVGN